MKQCDQVCIHLPASLHRCTEQLLAHQLVERIEEQRLEGRVARDLAVGLHQVFAVDTVEAIRSRPAAAVSQVDALGVVLGVFPLAGDKLYSPVGATKPQKEVQTGEVRAPGATVVRGYFAAPQSLIVSSSERVVLLRRAIEDIELALDTIEYRPGSEPDLNLYNSLAHASMDLAELVGNEADGSAEVPSFSSARVMQRIVPTMRTLRTRSLSRRLSGTFCRILPKHLVRCLRTAREHYPLCQHH